MNESEEEKRLKKEKKFFIYTFLAGAGVACLMILFYIFFGKSIEDEKFLEELNSSLSPREFEYIKAKLEKSCKENNITSCLRLGSFYQKNELLDEAYYFLSKACKLGDKKGCNLLYKVSKDYSQERELNKVVEILQLVCQKNNFEACYELGDIWAIGVSGQINLKMAKKYYKKACKKGEIVEACEELETLKKE